MSSQAPDGSASALPLDPSFSCARPADPPSTAFLILAIRQAARLHGYFSFYLNGPNHIIRSSGTEIDDCSGKTAGSGV
jgi:hypothetical protein